jgi:hypothetical protein
MRKTPRVMVAFAALACAAAADATDIYSTGFEGSNPLALNNSGATGWVWEGSNPSEAHSGSGFIYSAGTDGVADNHAETGPITYLSSYGTMMLSFWHQRSFEQSGGRNYDGGVLELSPDNGSTWIDLTTVGTFDQNGYTGVIYNGSDNPLGGRSGWTGTSPAFVDGQSNYIHTIARIDPLADGQVFRLRWREGMDGSTAFPGWWVDDIALIALPEPNSFVVLTLGVLTLLCCVWSRRAADRRHNRSE